MAHTIKQYILCTSSAIYVSSMIFYDAVNLAVLSSCSHPVLAGTVNLFEIVGVIAFLRVMSWGSRK